MRFPSSLTSRAWALILLAAVGFLAWTNLQRAQRVLTVSHTDSEEAVVDATSPTGYAGHKRWLIVPEHRNRSYEWIAETQQMLAKNEWRVRHVDYDNAPSGRTTRIASPYRWWLGLLAWSDHALSGRPVGLSAERAALYADPLLHLLVAIATVTFVARCFGGFPAALLAVGWVTIYPLAGGFLPGAPDDHGLAWSLGLCQVLLLLAGVRAVESHRTTRFFVAAGIVGGLGLWIDPGDQLPMLSGILAGGILATMLARRAGKAGSVDAATAYPWRSWAVSGAAACIAAYLVEYFPGYLEFELRTNHPLYGLAWIGAGEFLACLPSLLTRGKSAGNAARIVRLLVAAAITAGCLFVLVRAGALTWLLADQSAMRLSYLPNGVVATNPATWLARDGLTGALAATALPLLLIVPAVWLLLRRTTDARRRAALAIASGPVLLVLLLAGARLWWWNLLDGTLLLLMVAAIPRETPASDRWRWSALAAVIFLPGLLQLLPLRNSVGTIEFTRLEVEGLIERSLAHWLIDHADLRPDPNSPTAGGPVIFTPPDRTASWSFHSGLRGVGSANWENRAGIEATVRIATAITADEALARLNERNIRYLVLPSWDADLDQFARWTLSNPEDAFVMALHHWALPPWLRPIPYKLPAVAGFEDHAVVILEVTGESNRVVSLSRLAEYFVETGQLDLAGIAGQNLQRYPTDLGALVALAQVEDARGNSAGHSKTVEAVLSSLDGGFDRTLAWDRRVSLAVVLARSNHSDLARDQVRRCLEKGDETRLRSLTAGSLFRLQVLAQAYGLEFTDPNLRELARKLLPPELRARL